MARKAGQWEEEESPEPFGRKGDASLAWRRQDVGDTEDENLWIASRLIWFDQSRVPDSSSDVPTSKSASEQLAQKMKPHRLL
ncbi:hypothetical protein STEG23_026092 [Scotinomys teguina]